MYNAQVNFNTKLSLGKIIMQVQTVSESESKEAEFVLQLFCTCQQFKMVKLINQAVKR